LVEGLCVEPLNKRNTNFLLQYLSCTFNVMCG
jgi:hypothetical protein